MKKSKYITKYDYINYYTSQPSMWFFTNSELEASYQVQFKQASKNSKLLVEDDESKEEIEEFDGYELYREILEQNGQIDKSNPLIMTGVIIDEESKKYIINYHQQKYNVEFFVKDFDKQKSNILQNFKETIKLINEHDFLIMFQPVFYDESKQILTKCDAIVKYYNEIYLIETKATSTAKIVHFLDLYFQKKIIETNLDINKYDISYQLCLIAYELLNAKNVSFVISDTINIKKSVAISEHIEKNDYKTKQAVKIGSEYEYQTKNKTKLKESILINDVLNGIFDSCPKEKNIPLLQITINEFYLVINKLWEHKKNMDEQDKTNPIIPSKFYPHKNDKSKFKDTNLWLQLKSLYYAKGIEIFKYSGRIISQSQENLEKIGNSYLTKSSYLLDDFVVGTAETRQKYIQLFFSKKSKDFSISKNEYFELMNKLKKNHVYFDFETINPPIRVIDNSLPFAQVVTQCSILKKINNLYQEECINLMDDPKKINKDFFKNIVDQLYENENCSYIVYNATFEKGRLLEFKSYINEKEYDKKIDIIVNNLFDLALFFQVSKDKNIIFIKELGGFYSIKKVLPLVEKYAPEIFKQTKCIDYHDLNIYNGMICQSKSLQRFFDTLTDEEWNQVVHDSKKYCENDVRAMVAVLFFIEYLYNRNDIIKC